MHAPELIAARHASFGRVCIHERKNRLAINSAFPYVERGGEMEMSSCPLVSENS